jgi:hypothetical protein
MAEFMTWYSFSEYGKVWFDAENKEEAEKLLQQVREGEMSMDELPRVDTSIKGGDDFDFQPVEEMKN